MIPKNKFTPELMQTFNEIVKKDVGFDLIFTQKPMNESYNEIIDELENENQLKLEEFEKLLTEFNDKNDSYLYQITNNQKDIQDYVKELDIINSSDNIDKSKTKKIKEFEKSIANKNKEIEKIKKLQSSLKSDYEKDMKKIEKRNTTKIVTLEKQIYADVKQAEKKKASNKKKAEEEKYEIFKLKYRDVLWD